MFLLFGAIMDGAVFMTVVTFNLLAAFYWLFLVSLNIKVGEHNEEYNGIGKYPVRK